MGFLSSMRKRARRRAARNREKAFIAETIQASLSDLTVRHGPFKGMKYPRAASVGSTLYPKLLGSYESELHDIISRIRGTHYSDVVDVGCAEGYYAVGFGVHMPAATLYAYDTNSRALGLCREMARLNGIDDERLRLGAFLDNAELHSLPLGPRALIVSDCEGYEKELFKPDSPGVLANHDVLVEAHDMIDIHISGYLKGIFEATHDLTVVSSVDDIHKAQRYEYPELDGFSLPERKVLLSEGRASAMEWLFFQARAH